MPILLLTGPPAAGKNAVAKELAKLLPRLAVIDVDDVRWMIVSGHVAPWGGDEGARQQQLGVENACALASNFAREAISTVILDVVTDETAASYRQQLASAALTIVRLLLTVEEVRQRNRIRPPVLRSEEVEALYQGQAQFTDFDETIDNTELSPEVVAQRLVKCLAPQET